jgi:excisionase family DNA binding protein
MTVLERTQDKMLTTKEVADMIGVTYSYVCQLIRDGKISATRIGERVYLIPESEAKKLLVRSSVGRPRSKLPSQVAE